MFLVLLSAEFVALALVLVYIGAVIVLFLFGVMITRAPLGRDVALDHPSQVVPARSSPSRCSVSLAWGSIQAFGATEIRGIRGSQRQPRFSGRILLGRFVVPFEVVSFLLLAALIGGITLARKDLTPAEEEAGSSHGGAYHSPRPEGRHAGQPIPGPGGASVLAWGLRSLVRRNAVMVLLAIELMLNAVNINLIAFEAVPPHQPRPSARCSRSS